MDFHFYRLAYNPFAASSPVQLYWSRSHQALWDCLIQSVDQRQGMTVLIGSTGSGKTALLNAYRSRVDPKRTRVLADINAALSYPALLANLAHACGIETASNDIDALTFALRQYLTDETAQGGQTVYLIDDAHTLPTEALHNLRHLSEQLTSPAGSLLPIVLCGRTVLERRCSMPELQQFKASIGTLTRLAPLDQEESFAYIRHHLEMASTELSPIFTKGVMKLIVEQAHGIPKVLNIICTDVLVAGLLRGENPISVRTAREVIGDAATERMRPLPRWSLIGLTGVLLLVGLWSMLPSGKPANPSLTRPETATPRSPAAVVQTVPDPPSTATTPSAPTSPIAQLATRDTSPERREQKPAAPPPVPASEPTQEADPVRPDAAALALQEPATPPSQAALATAVSLPLALPLRDSVLQASLTPTESPQNPTSAQKALQEPVSTAERPVPETTGDGLDTPPSRMVCVMPRTRGNRGSDIVFIDQQVEGIHRLVSDGLQNMSPVLSPDGTKLAYTSYRNGAPNIFLRDLKSGQEQPLTSGPWLALPGAWSPNGRYLALSQSLEGNNDIFLYDLQRQRLRRLTTHPGIDVSPSFAPDSKRLVFASDRTGSPQLYLTDLTGKTPVRLTQTGSYNTSPAWSPHNDTIAFIGRSADQALDLYLIQADGTKLQRLTEGQHFHAPPTWSPSGNMLMGMGLRGSSWERHLVNISDKPNTHRLPQEGPLCLAPQWVAQRVP
ncbi:MAG: AAA family ATPase [Candidatus Tectomicrobia bacterium]|nr:AAA family ATPase [Candidatus Tectomicrobia bacterium]